MSVLLAHRGVLISEASSGQRDGTPSPLRGRDGEKLCLLLGLAKDTLHHHFYLMALMQAYVRFRGEGYTIRGEDEITPEMLSRSAKLLWEEGVFNGLDVILIGNRVAKAFGFEGRPLTWQTPNPNERSMGRPNRIGYVPHYTHYRWWVRNRQAAQVFLLEAADRLNGLQTALAMAE